MTHLVTIQDSKMSLHHFCYRKETGAENMATDMWLLEHMHSWSGQVFRRYGWAKPQITFGYGQKADWVIQNTRKDLASLIRRPTGGGIVHHGTDLTYCLVLSKGSVGEQMPPMQLYGLIHQRWGEVLGTHNIENCLMPCPEKNRSGIPGECFNEPVGRDLMNGNATRKLGGAAMKRTRRGVLIQGTLELGDWPNLDHETMEQHFLQLIAKDLDERISPIDWPVDLEDERLPLVETYSSSCWTRERKTP